ncbi:MAG: hypothetical protein GY754_08990 [bacterium]|nr:hypothetical protein [bacterium]
MRFFILFVAVIFTTICSNAAGPIKIYFAPGQEWEGYYQCGQGETSLVLKIQEVSKEKIRTERGDAYGVRAIFDFNFRNGKAVGAFYLDGRYYPEKNLVRFEPRKWIKQPAGYVSVGMHGSIFNEGNKYSGHIMHKACQKFSLWRVK